MSGPTAAARFLPTGPVTFLVADLDPSVPGVVDRMPGETVEAVVEAHNGRWSEAASPKETPVAAFGSARAAAAAALALRAGLTALSDRLRIALHSGDARVRADGRYVGPAVR